MFQTRCTILRAYTPNDFDKLLSFINNPLIQNTLISDSIVPCDRQSATKKVEEMINESLLYVIIETNQNMRSTIGAASITMTSTKNSDASFSISIEPRVWNKGFATEVTAFLVDYAFNNLALHRISLEVLDSNPGAIKAFKKVGFTEEGRKRKANFFNGEWQSYINARPPGITSYKCNPTRNASSIVIQQFI